jgi:hypothetical protein
MARPSQRLRSLRRALVIGIDQYPFIEAQPLHGCANDARRIAALLEGSFFFEVLLRLDDAATRDALLNDMRDLLETAQDEDCIVVHFSGHGSQIKAADGAFIETLVPHDSGRGQWPNRDITDRELYAWVLRLSAKTPYISLVFDSCHAGGALRDSQQGSEEGTTRDLDGCRFEGALREACRGLACDPRPSSLEGKQAFLPAAAREERGVLRRVGLSGWLPSEGFALIAACRTGERAREIVDQATNLHHGLLTHSLCEELARPTGPRSHLEVFEPVARRVTTSCGDQHPLLVGAWDREVLGTVFLRPMRFVPVVAREGLRMTLGAGAVHGMEAGSEWLVYPAGTRRQSDAHPLGRVRLDEVLASQVRGELVTDGSVGVVAAGDRAVELRRPAHSWRLEVELGETIDSREEEQLAGAIDASPWLARVSGAALAIECTDPFAPRAKGSLPQGDARSWAVLYRSGDPVLPPLPARSTAVRRLVMNLETLARKRRLAELRHPDPTHLLRNVLAIELLRREPHGVWLPAQPAVKPVFNEGDELAIRLYHRYGSPLYVGILDLGSSASIELLHPLRGAHDPLPPGQELEVGLRPDDVALVPYLPAVSPFTREPLDQALETLVFLATAEPADFGLWIQRGVHGPTESDRDEDEERMGAIREGPPETPPVHWTATSRSFWIRAHR